MKQALKAGLIAIIAVGTIEAMLANKENDSFQFCTTKAYGWPAPWKIAYCECEGGETIYPKLSVLVNLSTIIGGGIAGFILLLGIKRRRTLQE